jgi:hypothetical protein
MSPGIRKTLCLIMVMRTTAQWGFPLAEPTRGWKNKSTLWVGRRGVLNYKTHPICTKTGSPFLLDFSHLKAKCGC